jgi:hypothetical protein
MYLNGKASNCTFYKYVCNVGKRYPFVFLRVNHLSWLSDSAEGVQEPTPGRVQAWKTFQLREQLYLNPSPDIFLHYFCLAAFCPALLGNAGGQVKPGVNVTYVHYFCRYSSILGEKMASCLKMLWSTFCENLKSFEQKTPILREILNQKIFLKS